MFWSLRGRKEAGGQGSEKSHCPRGRNTKSGLHQKDGKPLTKSRKEKKNKTTTVSRNPRRKRDKTKSSWKRDPSFVPLVD